MSKQKGTHSIGQENVGIEQLTSKMDQLLACVVRTQALMEKQSIERKIGLEIIKKFNEKERIKKHSETLVSQKKN